MASSQRPGRTTAVAESPGSVSYNGGVPSETRSRSRREGRGGFDRVRKTEEAQQAAYEMVRAVREAADTRKDAEWRATADANRRRVLLMLAVPAVPGVLVAMVGVFVPLLLIVGGLLVLVAVALAFWTWSSMTAAAASSIGGLAMTEAVSSGAVSATTGARCADLAAELCATLGLPLPQMRVIRDAAPNALSVGRSPQDAVVFLTSGLLGLVERIELEAVIAHELAHVKRLDIAAVAFELSPLGKAVLALGGVRAALWLEGHGRESSADVAAAGVTRYPPGLVTALGRVLAAGTALPSAVPAGVLTRTSRSWLAPLAVGEPGTSIGDRIDVLNEL